MRGGSAIVILWLSLSCLLGCDVGANARAAEDEARNGASEKRARDDVGQPALRAYTRWRADRDDTAAERMRGAAARRDAVVRALFAEAGVAYPPAELVFRALTEEGAPEARAGGERLALVARYAVCAASGDPGPKRREGDHQVPEGFYRIASYNPASRFHLAMLVSYPNASDRVLSHPTEPGGEIMIHGA